MQFQTPRRFNAAHTVEIFASLIRSFRENVLNPVTPIMMIWQMENP